MLTVRVGVGIGRRYANRLRLRRSGKRLRNNITIKFMGNDVFAIFGICFENFSFSAIGANTSDAVSVMCSLLIFIGVIITLSVYTSVMDVFQSIVGTATIAIRVFSSLV